jgi:hypothetical protein
MEKTDQLRRLIESETQTLQSIFRHYLLCPRWVSLVFEQKNERIHKFIFWLFLCDLREESFVDDSSSHHRHKCVGCAIFRAIAQ